MDIPNELYQLISSNLCRHTDIIKFHNILMEYDIDALIPINITMLKIQNYVTGSQPAYGLFYDFDDDDDKDNYKHAVTGRACHYGDTDVFRWAFLTFDDIFLDYFLVDVMQYGHLDLLIDLDVEYDILGQHKKLVLETISSCTRGRCLDMLKWINDRFGISEDDVRSGRNALLRFSTSHGQLEVCKWIHSTFHLTLEDARDISAREIDYAKSKGYFDVVEWYNDTFPGWGQRR